MSPRETGAIESWHAHVYFDADTRDKAWALRETIMRDFAGRMEMGRFHERPVGPHPMWSYQIAFAPEQFAAIVPWLTLNRGGMMLSAAMNGFYGLKQLTGNLPATAAAYPESTIEHPTADASPARLTTISVRKGSVKRANAAE